MRTTTYVRLCLGVLASACAVAALIGYLVIRPWGDRWLFGWYVLLPSISAVVLAVTLFLPRQVRANVLLASVSLFATLYIAEAALHLRGDAPGRSQEALQRENALRRGVSFDRRSISVVIRDLRAEGVNAWPMIPAEELRSGFAQARSPNAEATFAVNGRSVLPLSGISSARIVSCRESGTYPILESDEYGFANPRGLWHDTVDLVALGDSYIQGLCTEPHEGIVAFIRETIPASVSVGTSGWGPLSMLAALKEYAAVHRPRHVLWFYFEGNDLNDLAEEWTAPPLRRYLQPGYSQGLASLHVPIDRHLKRAVNSTLGNRQRDAARPAANDSAVASDYTRTVGEILRLRAIRSLLRLEDPARQRAVFEQVTRFKTVLREARAATASWGGTLHFVYLPWSARYRGKLGAAIPRIRVGPQVFDAVADLGIPVVDVDSAFRASGNPLGMYWYPGSHYNGTGNRTVAAAVLPSVARLGTLW